MFQLTDSKESHELRQAVVSTLDQLMEEDSHILALEADLGGASSFSKLEHHKPRYIQCGISEANMIGVAAGLASDGFTPFCHTFGPFASRRVFDQVFLSGGYAQNSINIWGSDPGFSAAHNGGTHTTYEDVALMRTIPGAVVCDAADAVQMAWIIRAFAELNGVHYVRGNRKGVRDVYAPGSTFEIGKANVLLEGSDIVILAAGQLVSDALDAAATLAQENIDATVIDMFCLKPLDVDAVRKHVHGKKLAVTFENHGNIGGLGDAVASVIAECGCGVPLLKHGVDERFGQVGSADFLQDEYGLTAPHLVKAIKEKLAN